MIVTFRMSARTDACARGRVAAGHKFSKYQAYGENAKVPPKMKVVTFCLYQRLTVE